MNCKRERIKTDFGMTDYYKYYLKTSESESKIDKIKFNKIVSEFNKIIVDHILNDNLEYKPFKLQMTFCIRKYKKTPKIVKGKLINTNPIDWKSTKELWEQNEEAKEKKILIRFTNYATSKYIFRIILKKFGRFYKNKSYFRFKAVRSFQRALNKRIVDPKKETFEAHKLFKI